MKPPSLIFYGFLGLPLAMVSLPLYMQLPAFYSNQFGLSLSSIGYVLFAARLLDTMQDPIFGGLISRLGLHKSIWYIAAAIAISFSFAALWLPPYHSLSSSVALLTWLALMLYVAYSAHSVLNIAYLSWGAALDQRSGDNAGPQKTGNSLLGAATWREAFALFGVIVASIVPSLITDTAAQASDLRSTGFLWYSVSFVLILAAAVYCLLRFAPRPTVGRSTEFGKGLLGELQMVVKDKLARPLFIAYLMNSLAIALPASLMIFFVERQIGNAEKLPQFLVSYFLAGACGLPIWLKAAKRLGSLIVWQFSLLMAITAFVGAAFLSHGDVLAYTIICITSGLCLGADLVLPPVLLAERIQAEHRQASYFGIWTFLGKIALACSGLSLPLMSYLENKAWLSAASQGVVDNIALVLCYALIPCALKLSTFICLIGIRTPSPASSYT